MATDRLAEEDRFDALGLEAPFSENLDAEDINAETGLAVLHDTPFAETFWEVKTFDEAHEGEDHYEPPYSTEDEGYEPEAENEAGGVAALLSGPTLRRGNRGGAVLALQGALVGLGTKIAVDGQFGPATDKAVRSFQTSKGLTADGIVGTRTKAAIVAALGGKVPVPQPVPPSPHSNLADAIVRIAIAEDRRWHPQGGNLRETQAAATPILQEYYRVGIGANAVPSAANLQSEAWHRRNFWSAVFISYVMRQAGAGTHFRYSAAHRTYVRAARLNRLNGVTANPFWAYRTTEVAPQPGDLVCNGRAGDNVTYDNIAENRDWRMHCDIVTAVRAGEIDVIGGNVRDDVSGKTLHTLPDGRIDPARHPHHFAILRCRGAIGAQQPAPTPAPVPPLPVPPLPANPGRLVVDHHPLIRSHRGTAPDLILRWNRIAQPGAVDVVVHFHGYSGRKENMRIDRDKEKASGLDFADPMGSGQGRTRPTIGVLPRGNYFGGETGAGYNFPNLTGPGVLDQLVADALARVSAQTGHALTRGRLILTGHSGGGSPVSAILKHSDPDEVHIFDGMYGSSAHVVSWAKKRIARELATPAPLPPALRIIYRQGSKKHPGTQPNSEAAARELRLILQAPGAARLQPYFSVVKSDIGHNEIPSAYGWRLLANAAAVLPNAMVYTGISEKEAEGPEASEFWESPASDREQSEAEALSMDTGEDYAATGENWTEGEDLAWLDVEAPAEEMEWEEPAGENGFVAEYEGEDPSAEAEWEEGEEYEEYEGESLDAFEEAEAEYEGEAEAHANDLQTFETMLEAEGVVATVIERAKSIAAFVVGPTLRRGSKGDGVVTLQRSLVSLGASIIVDGDFGSNTEAAVRAFQQRSGLTADGVVGPRTKSAIAAALGGTAPVPTPLPPATGLGAAIAQAAEQEYRRWHPPTGKLRETDTAAVPILQQYYRDGVGTTVSATQLQDTVWQKNHPWSAVFVSWVIRTAAPGQGFAYSKAHQGYVRAARKNRLNGNTASPFWAYRATEVAPQVGDIIVALRNNSGATYDNIGDKQSRATHGDIVTEVRPGSLRVIGGNVNQNVDAKVIRTLPDGRLALDGKQARFFAVVRCRGAAGGQQPAPTPTPTPAGTKLKPAEFVAAYGPSARTSQGKHGVPALVTLGQAALESGWGAAAPRFNFFGIKAKATDPEHTRQLLKTREVFPDPNRKFPEVISVTPRPDGKYDYVVRDWFRAYPDAATDFDAHGEFLVRNKRYARAFTVGGNAYAFASEVARAGYATDPSYEAVLHGVMRTIEKAGGP